MHVRPHEKLIIWQRSYELCLFVYRVTVDYPKHELFSLTNQIRRASYSLPMNIAEGNAKRSVKEKYRYTEIAHASLEELHVQLRLSLDLQYITKEIFLDIDGMINRLSYLITKYKQSLKSPESPVPQDSPAILS